MNKVAAGYLEMMKLKIGGMICVTTSFGYFLARQELAADWVLLVTLLGSILTCGGGAILNNYLERDIDPKMERTRDRPIPAGLISPAEALGAGIMLVLAGTTLLVWQVNLLTGFLALLTAFLYVLVYTPLKRLTWLNTFVGAIPGALPPMGGCAAATGELGAGAWVLFFILFFWQFPHFYAIAWMYREDYRRGGYKMLPVVDDARGTRTFRQVVIYSILLIPASLMPTVLGMSGQLYFVGALCMGLVLLGVGITLARARTIEGARRLLRTSIVYLPVLFALIAADIGLMR